MNDADTLARTCWGEARGEGIIGMQAVACVIINREKAKRRVQWGLTVGEICLKPYQFSAWLANDPNRAKMLAVTTDDPQFRDALQIAQQAIAGTLSDPTEGADSYAESHLTPYWAAKAVKTAVIGHHTFYRTIPAAGGSGQVA